MSYHSAGRAWLRNQRRYIDDVFMTSNLSRSDIEHLLETQNSKDENIRITSSIASAVEFLDVFVQNHQGCLTTSVFHKPAAEPYIVPYSSDHPRHVHRNAVLGSLFRAVRLSSQVEDFDRERLTIELTLILNGYPPVFVSHHIRRFFECNQVPTPSTRMNQSTYQNLHERLLARPTRRDRQESFGSETHDSMAPNTMYAPEHQRNKATLILHYTFESGPLLQFKSKLQQLWKDHYLFDQSCMRNFRLTIGTRSNKNLHQLLVRTRPREDHKPL